MNYYFFLRAPGLVGSVTLANFPCVDASDWSGELMQAHVAYSDGQAWQIRRVGEVKRAEANRFSESDISAFVPDDASGFMFMYPTDISGTAETLPVDPILDTSPSWRGNIQISSDTTSASYQGEYPGPMLNIPRGTLLSYASFIQSGNGVKTYFILPNIRRSAEIERATVKFVGLRTRRCYLSADAFSNSTTAIDISGIEPENGELIAAVSNEITGIPLYLSHTGDFRQLTLEHTHPPAEMLVFGKRGDFQRQMKSYWLSEVFG